MDGSNKGIITEISDEIGGSRGGVEDSGSLCAAIRSLMDEKCLRKHDSCGPTTTEIAQVYQLGNI
jgi:hypothetical protein